MRRVIRLSVGPTASVNGQACGASIGFPLGQRTMLGADGMGGDPVEQQVGHCVGLLLEHRAGSVAVLVNLETTPVQLHATPIASGDPAGRGNPSYLVAGRTAEDRAVPP
jgi:hypothetical protein